MAIIKSQSIGKAKGSIGNITYTYVGGDTIGKGKIAFPKIPRTRAQMARRVAWPNIVALWQSLEGIWHPSFERAAGRVSDYNLFLSSNIALQGVYLTKKEAQAGGCVAAGYKITEGSLPSVQNEIYNGVLRSDISCGTLVLDENTTVADFSNAVVQNNVAIDFGDQISLLYVQQFVNSVTGVPFVTSTAYEITLDGENNDELLMDVLPADSIALSGDKLASAFNVNGAAAFILSRKEQGETKVSSQTLVAANSILSTYQSDSAQVTAILSYGGNLETPFLTPNVE